MHHSEPGSPHPRSIFHAPTRYALQALVCLPDDGTYRLTRCLATEVDIPGPFLAKVLQTLGHAGILESQRGPTGGFRLNRAPEHITLKDIVEAMEGPEPFEECLLGHHHGDQNACHCPIRPAWDLLQNLLTTVLATTTLRDLQVAQHWSGPPENPEDPEGPVAAPV